MRRAGQTLALLCVLALAGSAAASMMNPDIVFNRATDGTNFVISADGSEITELPPPPGRSEDGPASWSPDGTMIAFKRMPDPPSLYGDICIIDVQGNDATGYTFSEARVVDTQGPGDFISRGTMVWLGSDTLIYHAEGGGYIDLIIALDLNTRTVQDLTGDLELRGPPGQDWEWIYIASPSVAPNPGPEGGYLLAYKAIGADYANDVCLVKIKKSDGVVQRNDGRPCGPTAVLRRVENQTAPSLSRDGAMLAFSESGSGGPPPPSPGINTLPIEIVDTGWDYPELSQDGLTKIYPEGARATWSPLGDMLAFRVQNGTRKGGGVNYDLVRIDSNGTNLTFLTTDTKHCEVDPDWNWTAGEVPNQPPVADAGGPYSGQVGSEITFDGSGSYDPDGDILSFQWDFGDGSQAETWPDPTVGHTYATAGDYTVTLTVSDDDGAEDTDTTTAAVTDGSGEPGGISGTVTDADGPVKKAIVTAYDAGGQPTGSGKTLPSGAYTITGLAPGQYTVKAELGDLEGWAPGIWTVLSGQTTTGVDIIIAVP